MIGYPTNGNPVTGCVGGTPPNCNDNVACTLDTCNESTDTCDHTPNHAACKDSLYCNGEERCDLQNGCQNVAPVDCEDGQFCTIDSCNESADKCDHTARSCDDGLFCTDDSCNEDTNRCDNPPHSCDDGLICTDDSCNEDT